MGLGQVRVEFDGFLSCRASASLGFHHGHRAVLPQQGFSSSSVVKFNGVAAKTIAVTGTTFITATVPAGATDGFVTVTTGTTTLSSLNKFIVHNSWASGTAIPTAVAGAASGVIGGKVYLVGGFAAQGGA